MDKLFIRRSTERENPLEKKIFEKANISELQGLLVDEYWNPTVGLEAIQVYDFSKYKALSSEILTVEQLVFLLKKYRLLSEEDIKKRIILCALLKIKFSVIMYAKLDNSYYFSTFSVNIFKSDKGKMLEIKHYNVSQFINWWHNNKGTSQNKALNNGAAPRANKTDIDKILESNGLRWGGNIDGFIIAKNRNNRNECKAIIDFISVSKNLSENANPKKWYDDGYKKHGPKYEGFKTQSTIASKLHVPHLIIYIYKTRQPEEKAGISSIAELHKHKIILTRDSKGREIIPKDNVYTGLDNIVTGIKNIINLSNPPKIY